MGLQVSIENGSYRQNGNKHRHIVRDVLVAAGAALAIELLLMLANHIYPFGPNSFLISDAHNENISYLIYFRSIFLTSNDLFYTFSKSLGGDMVGLFSVYMGSPLNLISLFFQPRDMPIAFEIICVLKIVLCSASFAHLMNDLHGSHSENILFAVSYAFMGWISTYFWSVLWMDAVILLPLVTEGITRIKEGRGNWFFILSFAASILTDYYTGYMVGIFSILFWIWLITSQFHWKDKNWGRLTIQFLKAVVTAVCLSMFWLLPSLLSLRGGDKSGFFAWHLFPSEEIASLPDLVYKLFIGSISVGEISAGKPVIYCGMFVLLLVVLYFMNGRNPLKERISSACVIGIYLLSFCVHSLNLVWHGFNEPVSFPYRYAFTCVFFLVFLASESFCRRTENKLAMLASVLIVCISGYLSISRGYAYLNYRLVYLELLFAILMAALLIMPLHQVQKVIMAALVCADMFMNSNLTLNWLLENYQGYTVSEFRRHYDETEALVDAVQKVDQGFYRMEKNYQYTNNDAMEFNYRGLTHFSSTEKQATKKYLGRMGYRNNENWAAYRKGSTLFSDSFLGIRYLLSDHVLTAPMKQMAQSGNLEAYENPYALPIGFLCSADILSEDLGSGNSFELQNRIYQDIAGVDKDLFKETPVTKVYAQNAIMTQEKDRIQIHRIDPGKPASLVFEVEVNEAGNLYAFFDSPNGREAKIYVNGEYLSDYFTAYDWNILSAGSRKEGDLVKVAIDVQQDDMVISDAEFYVENEAMLASLHDQVSKQECSVIEETSSLLKYTVRVSSGEEETLLISIPYDSAWRVIVDGKLVQPRQAAGSLLAVELQPGAHTVSLRYIPYGFIGGLSITLLTLIWLLIRRKKCHAIS